MDAKVQKLWPPALMGMRIPERYRINFSHYDADTLTGKYYSVEPALRVHFNIMNLSHFLSFQIQGSLSLAKICLFCFERPPVSHSHFSVWYPKAG